LKSFTKEIKFTWGFAFLILNLVFIYVYFVCVLMNYDLTWMQFEKLKTHIWILENGKQWQPGDITKFLNTKIIEIDPNRLSRPLSNFVEVLDAKFRANLWDYIPPHPTLSLVWPFLFIGLPLLFYRFFRNLNCQPIIALGGTSLYLTSTGFLSPLVQVSHPGKSMVNFFAILTLVIVTGFYPHLRDKEISIKNVPFFWFSLISAILCTLITFFSDETGTFLLVALAFVFLPLILRFKEKTVFLISYFLLPIFYFFIIHFFLPWIHFVVNHKIIDLTHYRDFPHISSLFLPNWHNLFINFYLLFSTDPNLKWNFVPLLNHPFLIFLQIIHTLAFVFLTSLLIFLIYKKKEFSFRLKQIISGLTLLVLFVFFHTFQLSHNVHTWPVFWYGCLFSFIYYVTLTLVMQYVWEEFKGSFFKKILPLIIIIFTAHGLMTTTYLTRIFKNQSYNPGVFYYPSMFNGVITPYPYFDLSQSLQSSQCHYVYTLMYWAQVKHKTLTNRQSLIKEGQPCPAFMGKDPYFRTDILYSAIEMAFEFPMGHSFLNDPAYVAHWMHQAGEPVDDN